MGASFLAFLGYCDYITVNWKKIDGDIFHFVAKTRKDKTFSGLINKFFTHTLPIGGSFIFAFKYGFEHE